MKRFAFVPVVAALVLSGCASQVWVMTDKDHKMLADTHDLAQQAKDANAQAAADAKAAREASEKALALATQAEADAQKAAVQAQTVNTKADRMFQQSQNK